MAKAKSDNAANQAYLIDVEPDNLLNLSDRAAEGEKNGNGKKKNGKNAGFEPPNLGKAIRLKTPDFSDPNRKLTCLEVDFPIAPINALSHLEGNAGKPIYQMSKWWARRRSSVFRSLLIAAATEAPDDPSHAAKLVWDHYYCNHQKAGSFKKLKVLEPFMGGGTTVVEGSRLGFQVTGIDLNPVAWFVTKNEVACSDPAQVKALFDHIEAEVKPLIQPFYTTTCPRGHKGHWIDVRTERPAPEGLDPIDLPPTERKHYRWEGPEVIYTFWAKHGPCRGSQGKPCGHRTPIFRSPVIAEKKLSTKFIPVDCPHCGHHFDAELGETRMAPGAERVIVENEPPFTEMSQPFAQMLSDYSKGNADEKRERLERLLESIETEAGLQCPACSQPAGQEIKRTLLNHRRVGTVGAMKKKDFGIESRPTYMYLLIHPKWLEGAPGEDQRGSEYGGWAGADPDTTATWFRNRVNGLSLIEVRGRVKLAEEGVSAIHEDEAPAIDEEASEDAVDSEDADRKLFGPPAQITLRDGTVVNSRKGTVPTKSAFRCAACGAAQDILESVRPTQRTAPVAPYAIQCHCPDCQAAGYVYGGRFFGALNPTDAERLIVAEREWSRRCQSDLIGCWPDTRLLPAYMTFKLNGGIPNWGFTHWWKMFNARQLLIHSQLLRALIDSVSQGQALDVGEQVLGGFQQYLRNQNMFCFWDISRDCMAPFLSNANFHPKALVVENCAFHKLGRGNWESIEDTVVDGLAWCASPWDSALVEEIEAKKSVKVTPGDPVLRESAVVCCQSSSDLSSFDQDLDLAVTDPPFGNNLFYGDLADFFYAWMRVAILKWYDGVPERVYFEAERTPRAIEAVQNSIEHPDDREEWEATPLVSAKHVETIRERTGDIELKEGESNPLYRREPASQFYCDTLTACWSETARVLKPGGLMAFTFHHSEDAPWVDVLEALFNAGWVLVATYPIRSDETKGQSGAFGSRKIEYDIIHVCRKRLEAPQPVAWAKMRRWVKDESRRYKDLLERTHGRDLLEADLRVILRGKALEFYSRHYGQVLTGDGQVLGVGEALLGINLLLDDLLQEGTTGVVRAPESAEPASRLLLSLFDDRDSMTRDELHKTLRGSGVSPDDLQARGWLRVVGTRVHVVPITDRFAGFVSRGRTRKVLKTDLDQAHFLIGASMSGKVDISAELNRDSFVLKRSADAILGWYAQSGREKAICDAAAQALRLVEGWRARPSRPVDAQLTLFEALDREDA
ncbi:MAG: DUF1156 domain-containing protein [Nitrospira sp. CR1.3]|nr:DUF1156 domain-containing protein [Nitrospira sp. CR1.3]